MMVVVDRISVNGEGEIERVREALEKAFYLGSGRARAVRVERDNGNTHSVGAIDFDRRFNCSRCATAFAEPTTALFSSNSPLGACPNAKDSAARSSSISTRCFRITAARCATGWWRRGGRLRIAR